MKEKIFREYDGLISLTMYNITALSDDRRIVLENFDRKNKEHLYFLRVALMARDIYNMPLSIKTSWLNIFLLNWKIRKNFNKIPHAKKSEKGINVQEVLDFMREDGKQRIGENFSFTNIYDNYYEGSLN